MPVNKNNYRKVDLFIYKGEKSKNLVVGRRFLDCVTHFRCSSNSAELWGINLKFLSERV